MEAEILGSPRLTPIFFAFGKLIQDKTFSDVVVPTRIPFDAPRICLNPLKSLC